MFAVQQQSDVVLLDINMPAGTGLGALTRLKASARTSGDSGGRAERLGVVTYFVRRIFGRAMRFFSSTNTSVGSKFSSSLSS